MTFPATLDNIPQVGYQTDIVSSGPSAPNTIINSVNAMQTNTGTNAEGLYATIRDNIAAKVPIPTVQTKTANYTLATTDGAILGNATSASFTLTLPTAVGVTGQQYILKKIDSSANTVTIATTSSQTIDGATTYVLAIQNYEITVMSDGANWRIVAQTTAATITLTGDVTGSGSGNITTTLANSGVTAGTYPKVTVNAKGLVTAGAQLTVVSKTAAYTATSSDDVILANATSAAFTVTLPTSVGITGKLYTVKKTDTSTNAVTIATTSSQTIDGATTQTLAVANQELQVCSDGANWQIISQVEGPTTLTGDVTGSGEGSIATTLANSGVTAGTYPKVTVNAKGLVTAGAQLTVVSKTAAYTATSSDDVILANATSAAFTVTLPTSVGITGKLYTVKKTDTSTNAVTIATTSSQTIDGATTQILAVANQELQVCSDGANWQIISQVEGPTTLTGDVTGSGEGTIATTLANSGVTAGTYPKVTVNAKGLVTAGAQLTVVSKTAAYTATSSDDVILANATSAAFTVTLPTSVGITGKLYIVKKTDTSVNLVTLGTTSSQTIDGATTQALSYQNQELQVVSDGSNWQIVSQVNLIPPGSLMLWVTNTAPVGWLMCDGSAVSRSTYINLFNVISTTYGSGNGSTTFNLPDCRGKAMFGAGVDSTHTTSANQGAHWATTLGTYGGEINHALVTGELAAHTHSQTGYTITGGGAGNVSDAAPLQWVTSTTANTGSIGNGLGHNTMGPFVNINYIIKT